MEMERELYAAIKLHEYQIGELQRRLDRIEAAAPGEVSRLDDALRQLQEHKSFTENLLQKLEARQQEDERLRAQQVIEQQAAEQLRLRQDQNGAAVAGGPHEGVLAFLGGFFKSNKPVAVAIGMAIIVLVLWLTFWGGFREIADLLTR